ncbi:MAG: COX15/CtaA family protein [Planctomycetota bacterium]
MQQRPNHQPTAAWLTAGVGAASASWVTAYLLHLPGLNLPVPLQVAVLAVVLFGALAIAGRTEGSGRLRTGLLAGLTAGSINLLLLGSLLVEQPEGVSEMESAANDFRPNAVAVVLGFLAFSTALGTGAWALTKRRFVSQGGDARRWHARLAIVSAVTFLPLLAVGGVVTSTESGMAVPDAVTSYGAVSFLFPFSLMSEPRIYFEHVHRLFGSLVGLLTLIVMLRTFAVDRRRSVQIFAAAVFVAVTIQGILGIVRVGENLAWMGSIHGVFAQIVFGAAVILALALWPWKNATPGCITTSTRPWANAAIICLIIQLTFGALYRHLGSTHALISHVVFSIIVAGACMILGFSCQTASGRDGAATGTRRCGIALVAVVGVQFVLGWVALVLVMQGGGHSPVPLADELSTAPAVRPEEALITTIHQATGASLLALACLARGYLSRLRIAPRHTEEHTPRASDAPHRATLQPRAS